MQSPQGHSHCIVWTDFEGIGGTHDLQNESTIFSPSEISNCHMAIDHLMGHVFVQLTWTWKSSRFRFRRKKEHTRSVVRRSKEYVVKQEVSRRQQGLICVTDPNAIRELATMEGASYSKGVKRDAKSSGSADSSRACKKKKSDVEQSGKA